MLSNLLELGVGFVPVIIAIAAIFSNNKNIKLMIDKAVQPFGITLTQHTESLTSLIADYQQQNDNAIFLRRLTKITDTAISLVKDKDNDMGLINPGKAVTYLVFQGDRFREITQSVMTTGVDNMCDDSISVLISIKAKECQNQLSELFGEEFAEGYCDNYGHKRGEFLKEVCKISSDWINSHDDRFRDLSLVYFQEFVNNFVRYYYKKEQ